MLKTDLLPPQFLKKVKPQQISFFKLRNINIGLKNSNSSLVLHAWWQLYVLWKTGISFVLTGTCITHIFIFQNITSRYVIFVQINLFSSCSSSLPFVCEQNTAINELKRQAWEEVARGVNSLGEGELRTASEVCLYLYLNHTLMFWFLRSSPPLKHQLPSLLISCTGEASLPGLACTYEAKTASGWALPVLLFILVCGPEDWVWSVLPWARGSFSGIWVWPAARPLKPPKGLSLWLAGAGSFQWAKWSGHDGGAGCEDGGWRQRIQSKKLIIYIMVPQ